MKQAFLSYRNAGPENANVVVIYYMAMLAPSMDETGHISKMCGKQSPKGAPKRRYGDDSNGGYHGGEEGSKYNEHDYCGHDHKAEVGGHHNHGDLRQTHRHGARVIERHDHSHGNLRRAHGHGAGVTKHRNHSHGDRKQSHRHEAKLETHHEHEHDDCKEPHCHETGVDEHDDHGCCKSAHYHEAEVDEDEDDGCCKSAQSHVTELDDDAGDVSSDPEKGLAGYEHVVFSVQGMTCSGCESKLFRSLATIPYVHNITTSLVLSLAEFDLDLSAGSVDGVLRTVKKTTGFRCEKLSAISAMSGGKPGLQELEVIVEAGMEAFVGAVEVVRGIRDVVMVNKRTVQIQYDSNVVGARDILDRFSDLPMTIAPPRPPSSLAAGRKNVQNTAWMTLLSACLTIPVLVMAWAPLPGDELKYSSASLALATLTQVIVAGPFYLSAIKSLIFTHVIEMDLLIVISTTAAYVYSVVSFVFQVRGHPLSTGQFFETSTLLVTLIMVGRLVSAFTRQWAVESISIKSLQATSAILVLPNGGGEQDIDTRLLQHGDVFKVIPDSRVATDGDVISGVSEIDESMVTGEARLVEKRPGATVIAGSVNGSGTLLVRLTRLPGENTISDIAAMVDEAKSSKPKIQEIADHVAGYFVPIILGIAVVTFIVWVILSRVVSQKLVSTSIVTAITYAIPVLVVSCPCAIGLAVPMVVVVAGGIAAEGGVIFKSAHVIENARKVSHVIFDKTGTLTQGRPNVVAEVWFGSRELAGALAHGVTANIKHPVSIAVARHLKRQGFKPAELADVQSIPGKGVRGTWEDQTIRGGNSRWLGVHSYPQVLSLLRKGATVFCLTRNHELLAIFGLKDSLRRDAKNVIKALDVRGIAVSIVSGDDKTVVQTIAAELGVPSHRVRAECTPKDKQKYVKATCRDGTETVLFCGDGTNDAIALAQATIGVHVNEGTDVAQSAADAVLVRPALSGILALIDISAAAFRRIVFNFAWSFLYNTVAILLAAGVFVKARIPPAYAGLGELVSVLPVIIVAVVWRWTARTRKQQNRR